MPNVFPLILADLVVEHRTADHGLFILRLEKAQHIVCAFNAFRGNGHVVIHKDDIGGFRLLFHSSDHCPGKAARTANVIVRGNSDPFAAQGQGIQSAPVVYNIHMEMPGNILIGINDIFPDQINIPGNIIFFFERCRTDGKLNIAQLPAVADLIIAVADSHPAFSPNDETGKYHIICNCQGHINSLPAVARSHCTPRPFNNFRLCAEDPAVVLADCTRCTFKLQMQAETVCDSIFPQLHD